MTWLKPLMVCALRERWTPALATARALHARGLVVEWSTTAKPRGYKLQLVPEVGDEPGLRGNRQQLPPEVEARLKAIADRWHRPESVQVRASVCAIGCVIVDDIEVNGVFLEMPQAEVTKIARADMLYDTVNVTIVVEKRMKQAKTPKAPVDRKRRRTNGPTRADLERATPELFECPHCLHWGIVKGYVCNNCGKDPGGPVRDQGGEFR
jgi:hypothetical protein